MDSFDTRLGKENQIIIRQKAWQVVNRKFYLTNPSNEPVGFARQDALKLKPVLRFFTDQSRSHELLSITPNQIFKTIRQSFNVIDTPDNTHLATVRFDGLESFKLFKRQNWLILDDHEQPIGSVKETGLTTGANLAGGLMAAISPRKFLGHIGDQFTFDIHQSATVLTPVYKLTLPANQSAQLSNPAYRRIALACALILCAHQYVERH